MSIMKAKKTAMSTYAMLFISLLDFAACCRFLNTLESLVSCTFCILSRISLNLSMTLAGMMFKFETSERIRRHYWRLAGSAGTRIGRKVKICRVLIIPQIYFIAMPKNAARKKFATRDPVIPDYIAWNTAVVFLVTPVNIISCNSYLSLNRSVKVLSATSFDRITPCTTGPHFGSICFLWIAEVLNLENSKHI